MGAYRKNWIQVLKNQNIAGWSINEHGQAIVIKVASDNDLQAIQSTFPETVQKLSAEVRASKEWLKFILYSKTAWFQYVPE